VAFVPEPRYIRDGLSPKNHGNPHTTADPTHLIIPHRTGSGTRPCLLAVGHETPWLVRASQRLADLGNAPGPSPRRSLLSHSCSPNSRQPGCLTIVDPVSIKYDFWRGKNDLPLTGRRSLYCRAWQRPSSSTYRSLVRGTHHHRHHLRRRTLRNPMCRLGAARLS